MNELVQKAMELTWRQCATSSHYCFICLEPFDPKIARICLGCNWLVCPLCGGCYCKLDDEAKSTVNEFYRTHCIGRGCPYGKEAEPVRFQPSPETAEKELRKRESQEAEALRRKLDSVERQVKELLRSKKDNLDPYLVDHGSEHARRVAQNIESLERTLEEASIAKTELGRFLTQEEMFRVKAASSLHDIGRVLNAEKAHALKSARFIESDENVPLDEEQRSDIADMCRLHSSGSTRELYGTDDLDELVKRGLISREEAYKATLLRVGDALDAGKRRVERNTLGESRDEVMDRINTEKPSQAPSLLSHWHGHTGFDQPKFKVRNGKSALEISFDSKILQTHGADVAYRVKDLLRDIRTTLMDKTYILNLRSDDLNVLQRWYQHHHDIFVEDIEGIEGVNIGG